MEEKIAKEAEERHLDSMEYESEGDIERDAYYMNVTVDFTMAETDNTEVEQEFIDALVEVEENIYSEEINTVSKTASASEALFKAILPLYQTFYNKKNQDKFVEDFYGLIPRSCELLNCTDFRVTNLIMIHLPDHLVGFYNVSQTGYTSTSTPVAAQAMQINPSERGPLSYIGGYVVSKLFKKKGKSSPENKELQELLHNMKCSESNSFISARTRGGLVTPCDDLVAILEEAEVIFRNEIGKSKLVIHNIPTDKISFLTLESPKVKSLWDNIVVASGIPSTSRTQIVSRKCYQTLFESKIFFIY